MAGLILRVRHSPGVARIGTTQDANETGCASYSRVCVESRYLPLTRAMHAVCQRGAGKLRLLIRPIDASTSAGNPCKSHAINYLLLSRFGKNDREESCGV